MKLNAGSWSDADHFMMTYYHHHQSGAISQNTQQRNSTESDGTAFEEKLSTRLRWQMTQNIRNAHHTLFHRLRNCTATTKDTGLRTAALSTADVLISSPLRQTFLPQKSQRSQSSLTCWSTAVEERERKRERMYVCVCVCVVLRERVLPLPWKRLKDSANERKQKGSRRCRSGSFGCPPTYIRARLRRTRTLESRDGWRVSIAR